jgi:hypothetical protein
MKVTAASGGPIEVLFSMVPAGTNPRRSAPNSRFVKIAAHCAMHKYIADRIYHADCHLLVGALRNLLPKLSCVRRRDTPRHNWIGLSHITDACVNYY